MEEHGIGGTLCGATRTESLVVVLTRGGEAERCVQKVFQYLIERSHG